MAVRHHSTANTLLGVSSGPGRAVAAVNGWIVAIHIKSVTTSNIVTHLMGSDNQVPIERSGVLDIVVVIVLRPPAPLQCRDPCIVALRVACSSHIGKTPPADASKKMGDIGSLQAAGVGVGRFQSIQSRTLVGALIVGPILIPNPHVLDLQGHTQVAVVKARGCCNDRCDIVCGSMVAASRRARRRWRRRWRGGATGLRAVLTE